MKLDYFVFVMAVAFGCSDEKSFVTSPKQSLPQSQDSVASELEEEIIDGQVVEEIEAPVEKNETPKVPVKLSATFLTGEQKSGSLVVDGSESKIESKILMTSNGNLVTESFRQSIRPQIMRDFRQGFKGTTLTETFNQVNLGVLDIVLVVDTSSSMVEEHINLADRLDPLISSIGKSNWRIGLVTTDPKKGCIVKTFFNDQKDVRKDFKETILNLGINGSGNERGILQAVNAMDCKESRWMRDNSNVAVVIVSDEDNCSDGSDCDGKNYKNASYLTDALKNKPLNRVLKVSAKVYGIFAIPDTVCETRENVANIYHDAVVLTDGVEGSICDKDYSTTLNQISKDMLNNLVMQFPLAQTPLSNSVKIFVNGTEIVSGFSISGKMINFVNAPPENSTIVVKYDTKSSTLESEFKIDKEVDTDELVVTVDGSAVNNTEYTYNASSGTISLHETPKELASIIAKYKSLNGVNQTFILKEAPQSEPRIIVNNFVLSRSTFIINNGNQIVFRSPPPDGSNITVTFAGPEFPILKYSIPLDLNQAAEYAVFDSQGTEVETSFDGISLIFLPRDYIKGRELTLYARFIEKIDKVLVFPELPIGDSITMETLAKNCNSDDIQTDNLNVKITCPLGDSERITIFYDFALNPLTSFVLPGDFNSDTAHWVVKVDGKNVEDFIRNDKIITFPSNLGLGHSVYLEANFEI